MIYNTFAFNERNENETVAFIADMVMLFIYVCVLW